MCQRSPTTNSKTSSSSRYHRTVMSGSPPSLALDGLDRGRQHAMRVAAGNADAHLAHIDADRAPVRTGTYRMARTSVPSGLECRRMAETSVPPPWARSSSPPPPPPSARPLASPARRPRRRVARGRVRLRRSPRARRPTTAARATTAGSPDSAPRTAVTSLRRSSADRSVADILAHDVNVAHARSRTCDKRRDPLAESAAASYSGDLLLCRLRLAMSSAMRSGSCSRGVFSST